MLAFLAEYGPWIAAGVVMLWVGWEVFVWARTNARIKRRLDEWPPK